MQTFAELLTDYMERVGISDSELARALGVRRQTIFRWKEGLVEKPRYRDDVLRVVDKLRLTAAERDELLLAAGFAPEHPVAPEPEKPTELPPITIVETSPALVPIETVAPGKISARARPRWLWGVALIFVLVVAGGAWFFATNQNSNLPIAAPGEILVIIAPFSGDFKTPIVTPQRQFGETFAPLDASSRLQAAIEREVRAARMERVHVAIAPESIVDAARAEQIRQRTNATMVVWGESKNQAIVAGFALAPLAARIDDLPLEALVTAPTDARLTIAGESTEELQTLALVGLSQLHLARGDFGMARAALALASSNTLSDPNTSASLNLFAGYTAQISKPPELGAAMQFYSQTIAVAPGIQSAFLNRGIVYIRLNDATGWQSDFARVPDQANMRLALCWAYVLDKQPDLALPHCDVAVSRDATARSREARAIVYAQAGKLSEAAADLQIFVDWLVRQPESLRVRYGTSRAEWLTMLRAGKNPIDDAVLDKLRQE